MAPTPSSRRPKRCARSPLPTGCSSASRIWRAPKRLRRCAVRSRRSIPSPRSSICRPNPSTAQCSTMLPARAAHFRAPLPPDSRHDVRADSFRFARPIPRARFDAWLADWPSDGRPRPAAHEGAARHRGRGIARRSCMACSTHCTRRFRCRSAVRPHSTARRWCSSRAASPPKRCVPTRKSSRPIEPQASHFAHNAVFRTFDASHAHCRQTA
jgi:hypothetical protein